MLSQVTNGNHRMASPSDPSPLHTLAGSPERLEQELAIVMATEMSHAPYLFQEEKTPTRLDRARRWVLDGKVRPLSGDGQYFEVDSSEAGKTYTIRGHHCNCDHADKGRSLWCYHACSVELYRRTQRRLAAPAPMPSEAPSSPVLESEAPS